MCLLKTGDCLTQVHFNAFALFGNCTDACLIQVACLIEVATKTGFKIRRIRKFISSWQFVGFLVCVECIKPKVWVDLRFYILFNSIRVSFAIWTNAKYLTTYKYRTVEGW